MIWKDYSRSFAGLNQHIIPLIILIFQICIMDQEDFIKIEHQSPIKTTPNLVNYYMTQFYDHDSVEEHDTVKREDSQQYLPIDTDELLERLYMNVDIRTMSVPDITVYAKDNFCIKNDINWDDFQQKLRKRKMIMKRNHAKSREGCEGSEKKSQYYVICDNVEGVDIKEQLQAQIKKKRNRMSAQISRDRRKMKIQELEINNKKLKAQTQKIMHQNEKLKKQLDQFNKVQDKKVQTKGKNKFLSFLIMLGMFFLLTILRQTAKTNQSMKVTGKLSKGESQIFSAQEQSRIIENGQKAFKELQIDGPPLIGSKKMAKNVLFKLEEMKSNVQDVQISVSLKREFDMIKYQSN